MFPHVDEDYVTDLLEQFNGSIEAAVEHMIEKGYKKKRIANRVVGTSNLKESAKIDFNDTSWSTSSEYMESALKLLEHEFPFIRISSLRNFFLQSKSKYSICRDAIEENFHIKAGEITKPLKREEFEKWSAQNNNLGLSFRNTFKFVYD
jgi:hypothetical protein